MKLEILDFGRRGVLVWFLYKASPEQGDLQLSRPPSGQGAGGGIRTHDRRVRVEEEGWWKRKETKNGEVVYLWNADNNIED
ncbi:hypothetical protein PoB_004038700 [Plakobranchus ocellatus]|uniref:Uncharacterized protein n=1 Tax=Plakobranchus ocellatus TaxID=259542 RepID=A0AAV4B2Y9_9GAST|nr:hypothetical protein PoB_004038700 [Plakobranchus ocellatus]